MWAEYHGCRRQAAKPIHGKRGVAKMSRKSLNAVREFAGVLVDCLDAQFPNNPCIAGDKVLKGSNGVRNSRKV